MGTLVKEDIVSELDACRAEEAIDALFEKFSVSDYNERIDYLNNCMGNPETYYSFGNEAHEDNVFIYQFTKKIFLSGTWKIHRLYDILEKEGVLYNVQAK